jgi:hypothetical protein
LQHKMKAIAGFFKSAGGTDVPTAWDYCLSSNHLII